MKQLIVYDRSRVSCDWLCPRKRFLAYEYDGKGLTSEKNSLELYLGIVTHDGLAAIANGLDIDEIAQKAYESVYQTLTDDATGVDEEVWAKEQATLIEGLLRGFYKHVWPRHMAAYPEIVAIEQEMTHRHDGMVFMAKPDLVVRAGGGELVYIEYKTTSSKKDGWINSWNTAIQLHSSIRAIEETLHEKVTGVIVQGLYKGYESYGKQSSPFCYAYHRSGQPPFSKTETVYEYKPGFKRVPTWDLDGGVAKWVNGMPEDVLSNQFPQTPLIFVKDEMLDSFFAQRMVREREIGLATQMIESLGGDPSVRAAILDTAFPQRFDQCNPGWGHPCGFRDICHSGIDNPLEHGYVYRVPHHKLEADSWKEAEDLQCQITPLTAQSPVQNVPSSEPDLSQS